METMTLVDQLRAVMTVDENGLLPCPFCGGEAQLHETGFGSDNVFVGCCILWNENCAFHPHIRIDARLHKNAKQKAIVAWNARAYLPLIHSLLAVIAEAHEALEELS